jgi:hypothetical protein
MAVVEQEETLAANEPDVRPAGHGHAAGDAEGVITAKLRHVDIGPFGKGRPIAEIAERQTAPP